MDRIHYAGDAILTGTEIARALLDYAQSLAQIGSSDTVEIPTIGPAGEVGRSVVLVGPASQLLSNVEQSEFDEVVDDDLVEGLRGRTEHITRFGAVPTDTEVHPGEPAEGWDDYDEI